MFKGMIRGAKKVGGFMAYPVLSAGRSLGGSFRNLGEMAKRARTDGGNDDILQRPEEFSGWVEHFNLTEHDLNTIYFGALRIKRFFAGVALFLGFLFAYYVVTGHPIGIFNVMVVAPLVLVFLLKTTIRVEQIQTRKLFTFKAFIEANGWKGVAAKMFDLAW